MTKTIETPEGTIEVTHDPNDSTAYVTSLTVSTERKRSDGEYGNDGQFASETVQVSPALAIEDNGPAVVETLNKARHLLECHLNEERDE